ncbi:MAG: hypothetical protein U0O33_10890 [Blautia sp.]|nr:hypothetical protein [uncultured Blautia sp.]
MSQEKVDKYKKEKANREKLQKREKRTLFLEKLAIGAVALVMVGWIGYSAYGVLTREDPDEEKTVVTTEMDTTAISDYLSQLAGDAEEAE